MAQPDARPTERTSAVNTAMVDASPCVAVCASSRDPELARVPERFARAAYFLLFEAGARPPRALENHGQKRERGASSVAVAQLSQAGVCAVVARRFGTKATEALRAAGIDARLTTEPTVREVQRALTLEAEQDEQQPG